MTTAKVGTPIEILLVEDNPGDVELAREALGGASARKNLAVAEDGEEGLLLLRRKGRYQNAPQPDLILLDLNLPTIDGREVLAEIKSDPDLRRIPVIILTSSQDENDILQTYDLHANAYVVKPLDLDKFMEVMRAVEGFWLGFVKLPSRGGDAGRAE
jgi:CheY-like chemotaxis protein